MVKQKGSGWHNESRRHSLARRGIKTAQKIPVMHITRELEARFDGRKSFYGKAQVEIKDDGTKQLYSYGTLVAEIDARGTPRVFGTYSQTTLRHIKDFLQQEGHVAESKSQIERDYIK